MPSSRIFESLSEGAVRESLRRAKVQAKRRQQRSQEFALDFLENRQKDHTETEIRNRYPEAQSGPVGERIRPICWPLTEAFTDETADAYRHGLDRELVDIETSEVDADATGVLTDELAKADYNERMEGMERAVNLLRAGCVWYQLKRGLVMPRIVYPQDTYPVVPGDDILMDAADFEDYAGFVVPLNTDAEDSRRVNSQRFVFVSPASHIYYEGNSWDQPSEFIRTIPNPFRWNQVVDTEDQRGTTERDLPLQMLTVWHRKLPTNELFPDSDFSIADLNMEINVQWSVIMHTIRTQGFSQIFMNLMEDHVPKARVAFGPQFAIPLGAGESATAQSLAIPYGDIIESLKVMIKILSVLQKMSPNTFSIDGSGPQSGFAKLVESLPKLEARAARLTRLVAQERMSWPRIGAILKYTGKIPNPERYRLRARFHKLQFPKTQQEQAAEDLHDFEHGLSTPAHKLAERDGISLDDAKAKILANMELMAELGVGKKAAPTAPPSQEPIGSLFGSIIRRPG